VVAAAATDLRHRRIPNWLTVPAMATGLVLNGISGIGFGTAILGMLAALGVYFLCFAAGFRGAGDGKLMGAVGAFVGWPHIVVVMVWVALLGGVAAIVFCWRQGVLGAVLRNTASLMADMACLRWQAVKERSDHRAPGRITMPHGPVIAAATLAFLLLFPR